MMRELKRRSRVSASLFIEGNLVTMWKDECSDGDDSRNRETGQHTKERLTSNLK